MLERKFQANLIKEIKERYPGCVVLKNDANYIQGFPDLLVLFENTWAALECKKSTVASVRPNQAYYVNLLDSMSFSRFVSPENKNDILFELDELFRWRNKDDIQRSQEPDRFARTLQC